MCGVPAQGRLTGWFELFEIPSACGCYVTGTLRHIVTFL